MTTSVKCRISGFGQERRKLQESPETLLKDRQ